MASRVHPKPLGDPGQPSKGWRRFVERSKTRAERLLAAPGALEMTADQAANKAKNQGKIRKAWADVLILCRMIRAFARGEYKEVSRGTMVLVVGAVVYFVSPLDAILDHIPVVGLLDDAAVLAWVVSEVRAEIEAFRVWEARRLGQATAEAARAENALPAAVKPESEAV